MIMLQKKWFTIFMDVFADEPNFEEAIAKARQEEKDKLYPEIEALKDKLKTATTENESLQSTIKDLETTLDELNTKVENITKEKDDIKNKLKKDKDQQIVALENTIDGLKNKLTEIEQNNNAKVQQMQLEIFKKEQLLLAGDEIVPGLVKGNTEEEIQASIEIAKQEYTKIKEKALNSVHVEPANPNTRNVTIKGKTAEDIAKMTREEYMQYRKENGGQQRPGIFR